MTTRMIESVQGRDLRIGDVLDTGRRWGAIESFRPYTGPLDYLWPDGARIARFTGLASGMTIGNDEWQDRVVLRAEGRTP